MRTRSAVFLSAMFGVGVSLLTTVGCQSDAEEQRADGSSGAGAGAPPIEAMAGTGGQTPGTAGQASSGSGGLDTAGGGTTQGGGGGTSSTAGAGGQGSGGTLNPGDVVLEEVPPAQEPCPANAPKPAPGEKPNFLWLISEDNSPFLGAYGDKNAKTPNIDQLAKEGVRFDNAFAAFPVCAPSRFSIFTGVDAALGSGSQDMRDQVQNVLPQAIRGWAEYLRGAGYYTASGGPKTDYNFTGWEEQAGKAWNAYGETAHYQNRPPGSPFYAVFPVGNTHESSIHHTRTPLTDPASLTLPPYHPDVPEFRRDWARYYDQFPTVDNGVKGAIDQLKKAGLYDNTIVFYFSDHGGVLPRSKRYVYDSGTHVPLIVRVPSRWCHIMPAPAGGATDRLVSLVDLGPTVLKVAGVPLPSYMTGKPFLNIKHEEQRDFVVLSRRRMDEQIDLVRSIRTRNWQYIYNFQPFRPAVSYIEYMYRSESYKAWDRLFREGKLNDVQAMWFKPRTGRQLYYLPDDPYEIKSLHDSPAHAAIAQKLDGMLRDWMRKNGDTAFSPEAMDSTLTYETRFDQAKYPLARLMDLAFAGTQQDPANLQLLRDALKDPHPTVRYWGAVGLASLGKQAAPAQQELISALKDAQAIVQIAAAEALLAQGIVDPARATLEERIVNAKSPTEKLYAGQAFVTFESQLSATPKSVFQTSFNGPNSNYDVKSRLTYLLNR